MPQWRYVSFLVLAFSLCYLFTCKPVEAKASLFLTEDVLYLSSERRVVSVNVLNRGSRTGVFSVRWLDHTMLSNGHLKRLPTGEPEHSLVPFVRFSPRRMTLKPGQSQRIKIALKRSANAAPSKEYYSHLNVTTINDDLEATLSQKAEISETNGMHIKARMGISIPVIWRHNVEPAQVSLTVISNTSPDPEVVIEKRGEASLRAYLHVFNQRNDDLTPHPVIMYPNITSRSIPLKIEEMGEGPLRVVLSESPHRNRALTSPLIDIEL
ncbi:hypothetical protein OPS25_15585 [Alteromonas ponticola]|uniref:Molecular chaperone n=1 Tax=Alteromonas aquimaris TaxID=2998417 RepID=A0ABT3PAX1_9ALTE|nr:hypothetical protein [Alteromonas aquimaris]MCW8109928.1 hypothetical protein [Alteromonas aquimaris]